MNASKLGVEKRSTNRLWTFRFLDAIIYLKKIHSMESQNRMRARQREERRKMNKKLNVNYFTKTDLVLNIGTVMSVVGVILLLFGRMISFYLYMGSWAILPIGVVLFIIGASRRSTDKDIEDCISYKLQSMDYSPFNLGVSERRIVKNREPIIVENYEYENGLHLKRSKKGIIL